MTLLFCDVSGSTALGEQLDPEVLRSLMGEYFAVARAAVERHGGMVEKFVGDAVLAVFGIPVVREDDPLRAVRAAAELRDGLRALAERLERVNGVRLEVRTGVNTGAVVAGGDRAGGAFATGDAVNVAARLEQAAPAGQVLLGASTYRLVRDVVEVEPLPGLTVKGKTEPLVAYRLLTVLDAAKGRTRRADAALIGRERERRVLEDALARVTADGRCQLVTVLGPAGIGKTRLLSDFVGSLDPAVRVLHGRCLSYGRGITFWPIVSVLRQAAGLTGEEPAAAATEALRRALSGFGEVDAVVDRLAPLMGIEGEPGAAEETAWAVRSLLEHLADAGPVMVVVDDLHWAEPALLDLIEHLRDETRDVPLLLVCPARPELFEQRPGWGGGALNVTTLLLEPLGTEHATELLAGLLGVGAPVVVLDAVSRWGDGNPLFLEEVTTYLIEEGVLVPTGVGWALTADLRGVAVPPTVTALLSARLDRLPAAERSLLEHLSVIGVEATRDEAAALSDSETVPELLASLTRKGLLRRLRSARGETFSFRHVLVREAAYDAVPKAQRAAFHERFAQRLTDHGHDAGGEVDAFVGHHLEQAARLRRELTPGAPEVEQLCARAADALASAAERARHADNLLAADQLWARSLELTAVSAPNRRRRLLRQAWTLESLWEISRGLEAVEAGLALGDPAHPDLEHLALFAERMSLQLVAGVELDPQVARAASDAAVRAARAQGDEQVLVRALLLTCRSHIMEGRWAPVLEAVKEIQDYGLPAERTDATHCHLAALGFGSTPFEECLRLLDLDVDGLFSSLAMQEHVVGVRAICLAALGRPDEAAGELQRCRELFRRAEKPNAPYASIAADVLLPTGATEEVRGILRSVIEVQRHNGGLAIASTLLGQLAALELEVGDDRAATDTIEEAASVTSPYDVMSVSLVCGVRAILASRRGNHAQAQSLASQALRVVDTGDQLTVRADLRRQLAEVHGRRGDLAEQRRLMEESLQLYRLKGHLVFVARAEQNLAALPAALS